MGIIVAPILTNMYMAMLENEFKMKCKTDPKLIWPVLFKRFIDDGFGITKGNREEFSLSKEDGASTLNAVQTQTCSMPKNTAGTSFHQGISSTEGLNSLPASCSTISY